MLPRHAARNINWWRNAVSPNTWKCPTAAEPWPMFPPCCLGAAGRVHQLCVRTGTEFASRGGEDQINAAVVETLRNGGEVFMLPQDKIPVAHPVAAILRY